MMKKIVLSALLSLSVLMADDFKQGTLFGDEEFTSGGYGGFTMQLTQINGNTALLNGGKGAWLVNHTFYLGGTGYGLTYGQTQSNGDRIGLGYGGTLIGAHLFPEMPVHLNIELMFGAGGVTQISNTANSDPFFVTSASTNIVFNMTKFFHLEAGVSYRYATLQSSFLASDALNGLGITLSFLFGDF